MSLHITKKKDDDRPQDTADPWRVLGLGFGTPVRTAEHPMVALAGGRSDWPQPACRVCRSGTDADSHHPADERYMARCIQLARAGRYYAAPNPMVGAVIAAPDGRIIGEGYHVRCGEGHAEVGAIASVAEADRALLGESTIYVSLEPCAHFGRTPPCADLIIRTGLKRCVVGCEDPFAQVHGLGIQRLRDAGIDVTVGVLEQQCRELNRRFITFHTLRRPYITLKWAQSSDRHISAADSAPVRLSGVLTAQLCHSRRADHDVILVGRRTVETDQPQLNVRHWAGPSPEIAVLGHPTPLTAGWQAAHHARWYGDIESLLADLHARSRQSLLVEGGAATLQSFIDLGLWDEAHIETAPVLLPGGTAAPLLHHAALTAATPFGDHLVTSYRRT